MRPSRSAINAGDALLSMDQSRWFSSASVQRGALCRHNSNTSARFLTEYEDHVGWCCRIARRAARKPPRAQAVFRTSSNSAVQRQVFPLGLPTFRPLLRPAFIILPARPGTASARIAAEFRHPPPSLSIEISSLPPRKFGLECVRNQDVDHTPDASDV